MLAICIAIAGVISWAMGLNFWVLLAIVVGAVLINGLIATQEDKDPGKEEGDK